MARQSILHDLEQLRKGKVQESTDFFCLDDVKKLWNNVETEDLEEVFGRTFVSGRQRELRGKFPLLMSIMLMISETSNFSGLYNSLPKDCKSDSFLPVTDKNILKQMECMSDDGVESFFKAQYLFFPIIIQRDRPGTRAWHEWNERLPFTESLQIGDGAFAVCKKVVIPAGYIEDDGRSWKTSEVRACKIFKRDDQDWWRREVKALNRLRKSDRPPDTIMLHFASLEHRDQLLIILPHAKHGDLRQFLYADENTAGCILAKKLNANLDEHREALFEQMKLLAQALKWLHFELSVGETIDPCAHMDLRPHNIMIFEDHKRRSPAGQWVIGDWGLAVFRSTSGVYPRVPPMNSERTSSASINAYGERQADTYLAPEVEVGQPLRARRSDVWPLVCIFCEVLAFTLGGWEEVHRFRDLRLEGNTNDRFYSAASTPNAPATVRQEIFAWTEELALNNLNDTAWINCHSALIRKYLVINPDSRPDSRRLSEDISHAYAHLYRHGQGPSERNCHLVSPQNPTDPRPPPNLVSPPLVQWNVSSHRPSPNESTAGFSVSQDLTSRLRHMQPTTATKTLSSLSFSSQRQIDPQCSAAQWVRPVCLDVSPSGWIGYLWEGSVKMAHLNITTGEYDSRTERSAIFRTTADWAGIKVTEDGFLIWGYKEKDIVLHGALDGFEPLEIPLPYTNGLNMIHVSAAGLVVLQYRSLLLVTSMTHLNAHHPPRNEIQNFQGYSFSRISFSNDGRYLHTWSFATRRPFLLAVWRLDGDGTLQRERVESFASESHGGPDLKGFLAQTYGSGCAMLTHDNDIFLSQHDGTTGRLGNSSEKFLTPIHNPMQLAIHGNASVLVIKKLPFRTRFVLNEQEIETSPRMVTQAHRLVRMLRTKPDMHSKLLLIYQGVHVTVFIANTDGSIELIKYTDEQSS